MKRFLRVTAVTAAVLTLLVLAGSVFSAMPALADHADPPTTGWYRYDGCWYYFKNEEVQSGWFSVDGKWYFANVPSGVNHVDYLPDYAVRSGWCNLSGEGSVYYLDPDADYPCMVTGWKEIEGYWYYFNKSGVMQTGWLRQGKKGSYKYYYLTEDGDIPYKGGMAQAETLKIDGKFYHFNNSGVMIKGWYTESNGVRYCAKSDGSLRTGWYKYNDEWYYFSPDWGRLGGPGEMLTNRSAYINGAWYRFGADGVLITGEGWHTDDGKTFYTDDSGVLKQGWFKWETLGENRWYYALLPTDTYTYDTADNCYCTGVMACGLQKIGKKYYYFNAVSGDDNQEYLAMETGWIKIGKKWFYFDPKTGARKTGWLKNGGYWYYLTSKGMVTGLQVINGRKYYFNKSGRMMTGFITTGGKDYYFNPDKNDEVLPFGACVGYGEDFGEGGYFDIDGDRYYYDADGSISQEAAG